MNERRRRTLANATKQQRAAQWIRENIIANQVSVSVSNCSDKHLSNLKTIKIIWIKYLKLSNLKVDRTDERISRKREEEEKAYLENEELEKSRRKKLMDGLMEFKIEDDKIKKSRQIAKIEDKVCMESKVKFIYVNMIQLKLWNTRFMFIWMTILFEHWFQDKAKEKEALQFNQFLDHVMTQDDKRREKAQLHKNFWDNQCNDLNAQRKERRG